MAILFENPAHLCYYVRDITRKKGRILMSALYWAGLIILCAVPAVAISALMLYRKFKKDRRLNIWALTVHIYMLFVVTAIAYNMFLNGFARVSRVDASPIAQLTTEQAASADSIMEWLEKQNFVYQSSEIDGGYFSSEYRGIHLGVGVRIYPHEQAAYYSIRTRFFGSTAEEHTHIRNDNDTEVFLIRPRDCDWHCNAFDKRHWHLSSLMRIENVVISLSEIRGRHNLNNDLSGIFIEHMVKMIKTEAAYE
jgi:hypothetical protein